MIAHSLQWARTMAAVAARRPSVWILLVLWVGVMRSSNPPGVEPDDGVGSWWSLGLATPGWMALELVVFHLAVVTDVLLAARAAGALVYVQLVMGRLRWLTAVTATAFLGAVAHVFVWCVFTTWKAARSGDDVTWSFAADPDRRFSPDLTGVPSMVVILFAATVTLTLVSLLAAAVVHLVPSTPVVIGLVGAWCVIEVPLTFSELGLQLARFVDPAVVLSPDAFLVAADRPPRGALLVIVAAAWMAAAVTAVSARRSLAVLAPR